MLKALYQHWECMSSLNLSMLKPFHNHIYFRISIISVKKTTVNGWNFCKVFYSPNLYQTPLQTFYLNYNEHSNNILFCCLYSYFHIVIWFFIQAKKDSSCSFFLFKILSLIIHVWSCLYRKFRRYIHIPDIVDLKHSSTDT